MFASAQHQHAHAQHDAWGGCGSGGASGDFKTRPNASPEWSGMGFVWNIGIRTTALAAFGVFLYFFGLTVLPGASDASLGARALVTIAAVALPLLLYQALFRRTW